MVKIVHADKTMPFRIGSDHCPGFSKLIEELGEVAQVIGKIQGYGGFGVHWDGQNLILALQKELGDLLAAVDFVVDLNNPISRHAIEDRRELKLHRFHQWHDNIQDSKPPNTGVVYGEDE